MIAAAATASTRAEPPDDSADKMEAWIKKLPAKEKNALLGKLLQNDTRAKAETLERFRRDTAHRLQTPKIAGTRTAAEILSLKPRRRPKK